MKFTAKSLLPLLAFSMIAATPLVHSQDATPAPAPSDQTPPPQKGKGKRGGDPTKMLLSKVDNVTDDQKAKIADISKDMMDKMRTVREDTSMSQDDKRTKSMAMRKDFMGQIRAVLTPDQQKQFDDAVAAMPMGRGKKKQAADGEAPPPPPANN